ncbi:hypothetical protein Y1Q_0020740 [Alligator mississippiensis]|uniref:Ig-like domain-containing protein n=1 Tax=Alligator mississippiensis TaxID=8496 RepID=A0A151PFP3_ALLMI|nr:hypothetical protein Y1Q_0020740 [Alligator mississippiensis]
MGRLRALSPLALLCLCLPAACLDPCVPSITPPKPVVPFGGSVDLNCTCANASELNWEVSVLKKTQQGPGWVSLSITNISDWSPVDLKCYRQGDLEGRAIVEDMLHVYELSHLEIHPDAEIVARRKGQVFCRVYARTSEESEPDLTLTLSSGGHEWLRTHRNHSLQYDFVLKPEQDGTELVCEAKLHLGQQELSVNTSVTLRVWAIPYNVSVWAEQMSVAAGGNIVVRCHAQGNPPPVLHWVLPSEDGVQRLDNDSIVTISTAQSAHNGTYKCVAENRFGSVTGQTDVVVEASYQVWVAPVVVVVMLIVVACICLSLWKILSPTAWHPSLERALKWVTLELLPMLEEGETYLVTCWMDLLGDLLGGQHDATGYLHLQGSPNVVVTPQPRGRSLLGATSLVRHCHSLTLG